MNGNRDFYLKSVKTGKYLCKSGYLPSKESALKFSIDIIKKRFKINSNATWETIDRKLLLYSLEVESTDGNNQVVTIKSDIEFDDDDLLYCKADFHYSSKVITKNIIYCPSRDRLWTPKKEHGKLRSAVLTVIKKVGRKVPD